MLHKAPESFSPFIKAPIPFGLYSGPVTDMGTSAWAGLRRGQRKAWMYAGAFTERYYAGFAIADAGIVATAFAYIFDAQTGRYVEEKTTAPFGFSSGFDPDLKTTWMLKKFSITPDGDKLVCSYQGKRLQIKMTVTENGKGATTIAPAGDRPFHHTYKNLLLPTQVVAKADGQEVNFGGNIGGIDFSKGYPPRHTFWNWASMNAVTESGIEFGVNLIADFNNSIENALWVNGEVSQLSQATFSYGRPVEKSPWQIDTLDGVLSMEFKPMGMRSENINALFMLSRFKQPFGIFTGTVRLSGQNHKFTGYGVVEEHFAKW
jgi:hypothetical protein